MRKLDSILALFVVAAAFAGCTSTPSRPSTNGVALPKEHLSKEDRQLWRGELRWPDTCEEATFDTAHMEFYPLAPKLTLIEVACLQGAYQGTYRYYLYDENVAPVAVRTMKFDGEKEEVIGTPEFNAKAKTLAVTLKERGVGDCGTYTVYKIVDGRAVLSETREKKTCDGKGTNPKVWPVRK